LSDFERQVKRGENFLVDLLNNAYIVSPRMTKFGRITHGEEHIFLGGHTFRSNRYEERGLFLEVSHAPPQGCGAPALSFWVLPSIYAYTLCHRTTKFDVGKGHIIYLGVSQASHPKRVEFRAPKFWGFSCIYSYTL